MGGDETGSGLWEQYSVNDKVWYAPNKFEAYGEEEIEAVVNCLRAGWLAPGPLTEEFERQVSHIFSKKCGVFVNSGSSANLLALLASGISAGDEVITPACTFSTVVAPLCQVGAKCIFVDVEVGTYVPSVEAVMAKVTSATKALFLPNLIGSKPDWAALRHALNARGYYDVLLIEDSCDTITSTPCTDVAVTSFYSSHMITAGGGGGMVMFNDEQCKKCALMYRDWGRIGDNREDPNVRFAHNVDGIEYDFKFLYGVQGYNFKSTEMNAAFGLAQLKKVDKICNSRRELFARYIANLKGVTNLVVPSEREEFNWLAFPLMYPRRRDLLQHLESRNIQTRVCFAGNVTRHPAFREFFEGDCYPNSDRVMRDGFLLGCHQGMTIADADRVCHVIKEFIANDG